MSSLQRHSTRLPLRLLVLVAAVGTLLSGCFKQGTTPSIEKLQQTSLLGRNPSLKVNVEADFCTADPQKIKPAIRYVFVVDQSTSNLQLDTGSVGTDPSGVRRFQPLVTYLNELIGDTVPDESVYFSLVTFNTNARLRMNDADLDPFQSTVPDVTTRFNNFKNTITQVMNENQATQPPRPRDEGWTYYTRALAKAREVIEKDLVHQRDAYLRDPQAFNPSGYAVFFISDGRPQTDQNTFEPNADVMAQVQRIAELTTLTPANPNGPAISNSRLIERITLNTAFYYNPGSLTQGEIDQISALMQLMSGYTVPSTGQALGEFLLFPQFLDFTKFTAPERLRRYLIKDVFIRNSNAVWENGILKADRDGDGLSDDLESNLGLNPLSRDTDLDGVSDYVEYLSFGCSASDCPARELNGYHINVCRLFAPSDTQTLPIRYLDSDDDTLNDCEETILRTSRDFFSSNGSWIPDQFMLYNGINPNTPRGLLMAPSGADGMSDYQRIKGNLPTGLVPMQTQGVKRVNYSIQKVSDQVGRSCYALKFVEFFTLTLRDNIALCFAEGTSAIESKSTLRCQEKRMVSGTLRFTF